MSTRIQPVTINKQELFRGLPDSGVFKSETGAGWVPLTPNKPFDGPPEGPTAAKPSSCKWKSLTSSIFERNSTLETLSNEIASPSPKNSLVVSSHGKRRCHVNVPPPTMRRDFRSHLDQTLDKPLHGTFDFFAHQVDLPQHVQEIIRQDSHEQTGLVGSEATATGLVPAQRILSLFDPVLNIAATIVYLDHLSSRNLGIGNNESDPGEKLSVVPLDLCNHSAVFFPSPGLVPEINQPDLKSTFGRSPHRTG